MNTLLVVSVSIVFVIIVCVGVLYRYINVAASELRQEISDSKIETNVATAKTPIFVGSRLLTTLPSTGLKYDKNWTVIPPGAIISPFSASLAPAPVTPGYSRQYRFKISYVDNAVNNTGNGNGSLLEMCSTQSAFGTINTCNTQADSQFVFNMPVVSGNSTSPGFVSDYYTYFVESPKVAWNSHYRMMIKINGAEVTDQAATGILYSVSVESWDIPPDNWSAKYSVAEHIDITGSDINCFQGQGPEYCGQKCAEDTNCKAFNYIYPGGIYGKSGGCCLKSAKTPIVNNANTYLYFKKGV